MMERDEDQDATVYRVVVNHEEQYSIWPVDKELPLGWWPARCFIPVRMRVYITADGTDLDSDGGGIARR